MFRYEVEKIQIIFSCLKARQKKLTIYYFLTCKKTIKIVVNRDYESDLSDITRPPKLIKIQESLKKTMTGLL